MTCTQCGKEYTPALCEACGAALGDGLCPQCQPIGPGHCAICGKEAPPSQKTEAMAGAQAAPAPPEVAPAEQASPQQDAFTPIPPAPQQAAFAPAPPPPEAAGFTPAPPTQAAAPGPGVGFPPPSAPGGAPPQMGGSPLGTAPKGPLGSAPNGPTAGPAGGPGYGNIPQPPPQQPPVYGRQTPPPAGGPGAFGAPIPPAPGAAVSGGWGMYAGRPIPTSKVPLGGWLMFFFVLSCIGLGFSLISLLYTIAIGTSSFLSIGLTLVFTILPSLMVVIYVALRDIKFKYWFYAKAILGFLGAAIMVLGCLVLAGDPAYFSSLIATSMGQTSVNGIDMYSLTSSILSFVLIGIIIGAVISVGLNIAWWVYFHKSRRVAYTFDPGNNPPR